MKWAIIFVCLAVTACTQTVPKTSDRSPIAVMTVVARQANACWFKAKDKRFARYRLQSELSSLSGKPRILVVPRRNQAALPVLVAQAERRGGQTQFSAFGPLLGETGAAAISAQLTKWSNGTRSC